MRIILSAWTILSLFLAIKGFIERLIKKEREVMNERVSNDLKSVSDVMLLKISYGLVIFLQGVYSFYILTFFKDFFELILVLLFMVINIYDGIKFYKNLLVYTDKLDLKLTFADVVFGFYNIGFLTFIFYRLMLS